MALFRRRKWWLRWPGRDQPRLRVVGGPVDADGSARGSIESPEAVRWRVNGYRCEVMVWPAGTVAQPDPQAIRTPGGLWVRLYFP
jgi:hypothetical protein